MPQGPYWLRFPRSISGPPGERTVSAKLLVTADVIENDGAPLSPAAINRPLQLLRHLLRLAHEEWEVLAVVPRIKLERERQGGSAG